MMTPLRPPLLLLLSVLLALPLLSHTAPLSVSLPSGNSHCVFTSLSSNSKLTTEVFVKSGPNLKVRVVVDGPILQEWDGSPKQVQAATVSYSKGVDDMIVGEDDDSGTVYSVLVDEVVDMEDITKAEEAMTDKELMDEGEDDDTVKRTVVAKVEGVYRTCIKNNVGGWGARIVEFSVRAGPEVDAVTGHVPVPDPSDSEEVEFNQPDFEGIEKEDVKVLQKTTRDLRTQLEAISKRQSHERHRMNIHTATNEASQKSMATGSLIEALVFAAVLGAQFYSIKYLLGGNKGGLLGV
jgi:hypothetical protein